MTEERLSTGLGLVVLIVVGNVIGAVVIVVMLHLIATK